MAAHTKGDSTRHRSTSDSNGLHKAKSNGADSERKKATEMERAEREKLVLWKQPLVTLKYAVLELCLLTREFGLRFEGLLLTVFYSSISCKELHCPCP